MNAMRWIGRMAAKKPIEYPCYLYGTSLRLLRTLLRENGEITPTGSRIVRDIRMRRRQALPLTALESAYCRLFVDRVRPKQDPVFVLGVWRSGTTLLHDLMSCDPAMHFARAADVYDFPNFIMAGPLIEEVARDAVSRSRPMDRMPFGLDSPAEETFALACRTQYSFHHLFSFPESFDRYRGMLLLDNLSPDARGEWEREYTRVVRKLCRGDDRRIVLKSPDITCKLDATVRLFPQAKYVHICRDPYSVARSVANMLEKTHGIASFQGIPARAELEERALRLCEDVYRGYLNQRALVPAGNLVEIRYEDLVAAPVETMRAVYRDLSLPGFEAAAVRIQTLMDARSDYQPNRFQLDEAFGERIRDRLGFAFEAFGYDKDRAF